MGAVDLVDPDRVAAVGGQRPAAGRPRRPPGRRGLPRRALPQAPRRPRPDRRGRGADAHRRDRVAPGADQPPRRARPAGRGDHRARGLVGRRPLRAGEAERAVRPAPAQRLRRDARPAERPLPLRRVRRAAPAHRLGPGHRHPHRATGLAAAGRHERRHDPRPRALRRLPRRGRGPGPARSASSTRRWSTSPGSATSSRSARPAGGSRTSPTTGCWSPPRPASPVGCRSGRATPSAAPPSSAPRSARSPASSARSPASAPRSAPAPTASTSTPPPTWSATSTSSSRPPTCCPATRRSLVERFRDELGDWRLVVHSPYGVPVHAPWALAINARLRERYGVDGQAVASDDGIVIRIPDTDAEPPGGRRDRLRARRDRRAGHPGGRRLGAVRRPASASAPPAPCCSPDATPAGARRCGSSGSARRRCSRSPCSTRRSRSSSRPCASASRTSTTCPR